MSAKIIAMFFISVLFSNSAPAKNEWVPNRKCIKSIERNIVMPKGAIKITAYSRYYSGQTINKKKFIIGIFINKGKEINKVHIVPQYELPKVFDGGCSIIHFKYNADEMKVVSIFCNGSA